MSQPGRTETKKETAPSKAAPDRSTSVRPEAFEEKEEASSGGTEPDEGSNTPGHGAGGRLTDRDRQLLGILARSRYLTTGQVIRLVFHGRHERNVRRRLAKLQGRTHDGLREPLVRRLGYRPRGGGYQSVWALTPLGYALAEGVTGERAAVPERDVGEDFLEHAVTLNGLYVSLLCAPVDAAIAAARAAGRTAEGLYARARHAAFRWSAPESVRLPWRQYDAEAGKARERLIQPDAVLELPERDAQAGRRYFLECEMGTHTVVPIHHDRPGSTLSKAGRYASFLLGMADAARRQTHYQKVYGDGLAAEVLFLVRSSSRERTVNEALTAFARKFKNGLPTMRALTFEGAARELLARIGAGFAERRSGERRARRRGELDGPELLPAVRSFYVGAIAFMRQARARARERQEPVPDYPSGTAALHDFFHKKGGS